MRNIARVLAHCSRDTLKFCRVLNHTLNVTNGHMLIRRPVDAPDGLYQVNVRGELVPAGYYPSEVGNRRDMLRNGTGMICDYPDLELIRPPFEKMTPLCSIPREIIGQLCTAVKSSTEDPDKCFIRDKDFFVASMPGNKIEFPFNMPATAAVDKKYMSIALTELLQYESVFLLREIRPEDGEFLRTPLVFGLNWGSCVLIMPIDMRYVME